MPAFRRALTNRLSRKRLLILGPFLALGLVLVVLWALVLWFTLLYPQVLVRDVQDDLHETAGSAAQETDALLREAEGQLRTMDLMLLTRQTQEIGTDRAVALLADSMRENARAVTDVMLANTDGRLWRIPTTEGEPYVRLGPDNFMRALTVAGARSAVVGAPLQLREGARPVLPLAVRLGVAVGEHNAAVVLIDIDALLRLYRARMQRQGMAIFLERDDGIALARWPEIPELLGRNMRERRPDLALPAGAAASGQMLLTSGGLDGQERIVSYQTLQDYPIRLFASLQRDRILGGYLAQRRAVLLFSMLVSLIAIGLMTWLTRVQSRSRLREAEREATADASPMGLFRCDLEGRTVYANETYMTLMEVTPATLAWGWLDMLPVESRDAARRDWLAHVRSGDSMDRVRRLKRSDGSELQIAVRTRPMWVDGRIVAHAGTLLDITEAARQQQTARMLSAIVDRAPDYIAQATPDGRVLYLNPAVRRRLEIPPDAPLDGFSYARFFVDGGMARYRDEILPAAERDGHWHGRWAVRMRDGRDLPVDCTVIVHRDADGKIATLSWMLRDISAELTVELERERNQAVMGALARSMSVTMLSVDTDERVLFCNRAFEERYDIAHRSWEGRSALELLGQTRYATIRPLLHSAFAGETTVVEMQDDDPPAAPPAGRGEARFIELNYAPLRSDAGAIIGAYGVSRDVTDIKQEQMRLLRASNTDPLTELLNRAGFAAQVAIALRRAHDRGELVALLYLDLDRFKPVNDAHGHPVGDALLKAVSGRLRHALRPQDLVARLGGDEFAVFLHHVAKPEDAQGVADKLVNALTQPFRLGALELQIGASVGFCVQWARLATMDALVAQADEQLYHAKRAGRGRAQGSVCAGSLNPDLPADPPPSA
ncbi:MAG: diguanylate cyclase [Burkholderiaceae bacterium]